ncbi:MAG: hypothetical protein J1F67_11650 [Muribaculaceae bacterium]|nr:hypothetical protein [Muribaculaceae bacterium]
MKYRLSKAFEKSLLQLSGKELQSALDMLEKVESKERIEDIPDCIKLKSFSNVYRIKLGSRRAFFTFHVKIIGNVLFLRYLINRG